MLSPLGSQERLGQRMDTVGGRNTQGIRGGASAEASSPFQLLLDFSAAMVSEKARLE